MRGQVRRTIDWGIAIGALLLIAAWLQISRSRAEAPASPRPPLALFTSLPLYWAEAPDIAGMLKAGGDIHWARAVLESAYALRPLDALDGLATSGTGRLLMAQPRPLSPAENMALDRWVRGGGRVLLFADPALTQDSAFALGDRRRPQDTVLLSPILAHWGLSLQFVEDQPLGERMVRLGGAEVPVNLPGRLVPVQGGSCRIAASGLMALCPVGRGRVTVIADAALLERQDDAETVEPRRRALLKLADQAFR